MKKVFSILMAFLILISGMHLSVASHFCGGELAAVKWSLSGKLATCGMEKDANTPDNQESIASDCCHNQLAFCKTDYNFDISSIQLKQPSFKIIKMMVATENLIAYSPAKTFSNFTNVIPPGQISSSTVSITDICVFRI
jgi:hypothetical protein